jgi:hypothetical protein
MPFENFRLLASILGKSAVILKRCIFRSLRMAGKNRWQALVGVPRDRQMLFFSIQRTPHIWLSLDKAFAELKATVPLNTGKLLLPFR